MRAWAWAPIWLPELFPTRMRATAVAFSFNAPRFISCMGPLIAGTFIVSLGGYGPAATIVGLFFILGLVAAPFLPETNGSSPGNASSAVYSPQSSRYRPLYRPLSSAACSGDARLSKRQQFCHVSLNILAHDPDISLGANGRQVLEFAWGDQVLLTRHVGNGRSETASGRRTAALKNCPLPPSLRRRGLVTSMSLDSKPVSQLRWDRHGILADPISGTAVLEYGSTRYCRQLA
jgi:hypothetical protein